MNIWASKKDIRIKHLLLLLAAQFKEESFEILETESEDQRAVRLANPAVTQAQLYVFTYGQKEDCYGVHIEYPNLAETNYSDTLEILENVTFDQLVSIMSVNLEIPEDKLNPIMVP